jgi:thiamine biosynthesis lipoprotein
MTLELDAERPAIATSGVSERGRHLWDPRRGATVAPFASMTVIGPTLTLADAFATAAFVLGTDGLAWVASHDGYVAVAIGHDGAVTVSDGADLASIDG